MIVVSVFPKSLRGFYKEYVVLKQLAEGRQLWDLAVKVSLYNGKMF